MFEDRPRIRLLPRHVILVLTLCLLLSAIVYGVLLLTGSGGANTHGNLITRPASKAEEMLLQKAAQPTLYQCPKSDGAMLKPSPETRHHKVILTWNPSSSSRNSEQQAVGYCLYRIPADELSQLDPKCKICEQVNQKAVPENACVDDVVQDGAKYYYVATAINSHEIPSGLSKPAFADVTSPPRAQTAKANNLLRCRRNNDLQ